MAAWHPIFRDIDRENLEAVKQHVLADSAVLEEKEDDIERMTPLIYAIEHRKLTITHWLIDHRGQHDVDTQDRYGMAALHLACGKGPLSIVQVLVASGTDPSRPDADMITPLMWASTKGHSDIVTYLLQLPSARATVDAIDEDGRTALSWASYNGHAPSAQLLLDAGPDPTIPAGDQSPLNCAIRRRHTAIAALLRHAINEPDRARTLHKARALLDAAIVINKARHDAHDGGHAPAVQRQHATAAAPVYRQGRLQQQDEALPLPLLELAPQQQGGGDERLRATVAFVLGLEEGGVAYAGLPGDVYVDLLGYMLPLWAGKGPEAEGEDDSESDDDDGSGSESGSESEGSD